MQRECLCARSRKHTAWGSQHGRVTSDLVLIVTAISCALNSEAAEVGVSKATWSDPTTKQDYIPNHAGLSSFQRVTLVLAIK